ncbi:MAG TPA: hypothetical protein VHD56_05300 [Tepidisphaeraceae bacterium]|nr:hypothetical protein [Tepidisphaeraceae bacterium]
MNKSRTDIWFPAKRYGWGWGAPICWQGWLVMLGWIAGIILGAYRLARPGLWVWYAAYMTSMTGLLISICFWKGETPRWRWGS